jgi:hypothetical protein
MPNRVIECRHVGQAGELLTCFEFVSRGFEAFLNPFPGSAVDVLVNISPKQMIKIQVKATSSPDSRFGYRFHSKTEYLKTIDLFAFVALDIKKVLFVMADNHGGKDKNFTKGRFQEKASNSLDRVLREIGLG